MSEQKLTGTSNVATPSPFIRDGYTLDFEIPEKPGVSAGISGKRRPLTNLELTILLDACKPSTYKAPTTLPKGMTEAEWTERQIDAARSAAIANHLVEWNVTDDQGNPVPINATNVSKIYPPMLLANIFDTVCGAYSLPDAPASTEADDEKN